MPFLFSLQREEKQTITPVLTNKLFKFVNTGICMEIDKLYTAIEAENLLGF